MDQNFKQLLCLFPLKPHIAETSCFKPLTDNIYQKISLGLQSIIQQEQIPSKKQK